MDKLKQIDLFECIENSEENVGSDSIVNPELDKKDLAKYLEDGFENLYKEYNIEFYFNKRSRVSVNLKTKGLLVKKHILTVPANLISSKQDFDIVADWAKTSINKNKALKKLSASERNKKSKIISKNLRELLGKNRRKGLIIDGKTYSRLPKRINAQGKFYNLNEILAEVNNEYLNNSLTDVFISWSPRTGGRSFQTKKVLENRIVDYISISSGYDFDNCPRYAVKGVVYHECLHIVVPPYITKSGSRIAHGSEFKKREKQFKEYKEWNDWHNFILPTNLPKLKRRIAYQKRKNKRN